MLRYIPRLGDCVESSFLTRISGPFILKEDSVLIHFYVRHGGAVPRVRREKASSCLLRTKYFELRNANFCLISRYYSIPSRERDWVCEVYVLWSRRATLPLRNGSNSISSFAPDECWPHW
jgi:hypothetical protein